MFQSGPVCGRMKVWSLCSQEDIVNFKSLLSSLQVKDILRGAFRGWHRGHWEIQILLEMLITHSGSTLTKTDVPKSWFGSLLLCPCVWACMCASAVLLSSQHLLHGNCCLEVYNVCKHLYVCVREKDRANGLEYPLWMKLDFFHFADRGQFKHLCKVLCCM